ncbi:hypothetical protein AAG570_008914 [Ranatra chinensis]|uniref:Uncharacterized protein n=1 Tax=Ranatra chinensis TaxID=642074 RepID=A0ABD0Z2X5_9HEMI
MVESSSRSARSRIERGGGMNPGGGMLGRRRRHKTVHFGEAVLHQEAPPSGGMSRSGDDSGSVHSLPGHFEANVQQLFTFIGNVLSAWDDKRKQPHQPEKRRTSPREAVRLLLRGDNKLRDEESVGSPSYKHRHWKIPAGSCTALFLKKVC